MKMKTKTKKRKRSESLFFERPSSSSSSSSSSGKTYLKSLKDAVHEITCDKCNEIFSDIQNTSKTFLTHIMNNKCCSNTNNIFNDNDNNILIHNPYLHLLKKMGFDVNKNWSTEYIFDSKNNNQIVERYVYEPKNIYILLNRKHRSQKKIKIRKTFLNYTQIKRYWLKMNMPLPQCAKALPKKSILKEEEGMILDKEGENANQTLLIKEMNMEMEMEMRNEKKRMLRNGWKYIRQMKIQIYNEKKLQNEEEAKKEEEDNGDGVKRSALAVAITGDVNHMVLPLFTYQKIDADDDGKNECVNERKRKRKR